MENSKNIANMFLRNGERRYIERVTLRKQRGNETGIFDCETFPPRNIFFKFVRIDPLGIWDVFGRSKGSISLFTTTRLYKKKKKERKSETVYIELAFAKALIIYRYISNYYGINFFPIKNNILIIYILIEIPFDRNP